MSETAGSLRNGMIFLLEFLRSHDFSKFTKMIRIEQTGERKLNFLIPILLVT